jgi:NIMA (never in mitosis gene a)-related kinase
LSSKEKENALNEVRILASITHPNICGYKDCFIDEKSNCLCLVLEFCDGGDVLGLIKKAQLSKTPFSEA